MKSIAIVLLIAIWNQILNEETVGSLYEGTDYIDRFDLFKNRVVYLKDQTLVYGTKTTSTDMKNATDLACSTSSNKCLVAVDFVFKEFTLDPSSGELKFSKKYQVREQSNLRIYSKIAFVEGSQYFLTSSLSKYGVNRFKLGDDSGFAQIKYTSISDFLECTDILVIPNSKYALISYVGYNKISLIDFISMSEVRWIAGHAGFLAPLTADISEGYFVSASEKYITKYKLTDGTKVDTITIDYIITGVKNVNNTDFVIVATWEQVYVYNFAGSSTAAWQTSPYFYELLNKQMTGGVKWNQPEAMMYFSGLGHITSLTGTEGTFCHPYCAGCSLILSEYKCTACSSTTTMAESHCTLPADQIKLPPGGKIDYGAAAWIENNSKTGTVGGFNIKDYYLYIIIGAGGLVGLCCIFCICKMCCKKKDTQNKNQVRPQQKDL